MSKELDINAAIKSCEQIKRNPCDGTWACESVGCEACPGEMDFNDGVGCGHNGWGNGIGNHVQQEKCRASAEAFLAKHKPVAPAKPAPRKHKITVLLDDVELEQRRANLNEKIEKRDKLTKEIKKERAALAWYDRNK